MSDCPGPSFRATTTSVSSPSWRKAISLFRVAFPSTWNAKRRRTEPCCTAQTLSSNRNPSGYISLEWNRIHIATLTDGICLPGAGRIDQQVADGRWDTLRRGNGVPCRPSQLLSQSEAGQGSQIHAVDELYREPHRSAAGLVPFHLQRGQSR